MSVTVSILIAAYNAEPFVAAAVRSALAQTLGDLEVILIDDGSQDRTVEVASAAAAGDPRFVVERHDRNHGPGAARNTGLRRASGRWIAVLDADDTFESRRLECLIAMAEALGADLLADNVTLVHPGGRTEPAFRFPARYRSQPLDARHFIEFDTPGLETLPLGFMHPILRSEFLREGGLEYPSDISAGEDFHLYVRCLLRGACLFVTDESYYRALVRRDSLSRADPDRNARAFARSMQQLRLEAVRLANPTVAKALARREHALDSYDEYSRFSGALHERRFARALWIFCRLALRPYTWRRLRQALRRRAPRLAAST